VAVKELIDETRMFEVEKRAQVLGIQRKILPPASRWC
jgi:hypothetical protein